MKTRNMMLLLLAVVLILAAGIGGTYAYFTANAESRGGYVIHLSDSTQIKENVSQWTKHVEILNEKDNSPIFVRVKAFAAEPFTLEFKGNNWTLDEEGFYRYEKAVYGGSSTADGLDIRIGNVPEDAKTGDDFNVIVVYETVPAVFKADGSPDLIKAWDEGEITVLNAEGGTK